MRAYGGKDVGLLKRHGRVQSVREFLVHNRRRRGPQPPRPCAGRKPREYLPQAPGDLVQVDTLTVVLDGGTQIKHFSAVDTVSRYAMAGVHSRATAGLAAGFLEKALDRSPFPIQAVQVDGGSEYMAKRCVGSGGLSCSSCPAKSEVEWACRADTANLQG